MTRTPQRPALDLTAEQLAALASDGVICVRRALDADWTARLRRGLVDVTAGSRQLWRADRFLWPSSDVFRDLWYESPLAHYAAQAMGSQRVNVLFDELCHGARGDWQRELGDAPVVGTQVISLWVAAESGTGGLALVRGSHRGVTQRDRSAIVSWDMEPGDALIFKPRVLHRAHGAPLRAARAAQFRFAGDDARYAPKPSTLPLPRKHGLQPGDPIGGPLFPQLLPYGLESERRPREEGRLQWDVLALARSLRDQTKTRLRAARFKLMRPEHSS